MFHFLQFRSNFLDSGFDLDEGPSLLHGGDEGDGLIKGSDGLGGLCSGDLEGGGLALSLSLAGDEEAGEVLDVGNGDTELFLGIVEELGGVDDSLSRSLGGLVVEGDLGRVLGEKLVALSSLHVVGGISL